jgi:tetratricopeptide (TPR) repeat protein
MGRRNVVAASVLGTLLLGVGALLPARGLAPSAATAGSGGRPVESLEAGFAADPANDRLAAELGLVYLGEVKDNADPRFYPKAEVALRAALEANPNNFEATYGMATLAAGRHDFHGARAWSRKAIALNPYNSDAVGVLGDSLVELGRYRAAAHAFQTMIDLKPGLPSFARISYLGELRGDIPGALAAMRQAFDAAGTPDDASFAAFHIGELHLNEGRTSKAEAWYRRGSEIAPDSSTPITGLAKIAAIRGDLDGAIALIQQLLEQNEEPGNAFFLGELYAAAGDDDAASRAFELGLSLNRRETANGSDVLLEDSLFAADHGRPRDALRLARKEYEIRQSVHVSDAYAWALYANGKFEQAQRLSDESLRIGTRSALFHFHAGMIALALDQRSAAINHLRSTLSLDPIFSLAHRATAERVLACLESDCGMTHR